MPTTKRLLAVAFMAAVFAIGCGGSKAGPGKVQTQGPAVKAMADTVSQDVGTVGKSSGGTRGAPVVLMEENHLSRVGQLQLAVMLVRLRSRYGLRDIALEGYLQGGPEVKADWFARLARGDTLARARVAVRLLAEGEVSCAEFMKLVYDDVLLHPIEQAGEYNVVLDDTAAQAPVLYLFKIAGRSLRDEHLPKLQRLQGEVERASGEEKLKKLREMLDYVMSADSWAEAKYRALLDTVGLAPSETTLALVEEIQRRAADLSVELDPQEQKGMDRYLAFYRGRIAASGTMTSSVATIADSRGTTVVAADVGAAHTVGMCGMLSDSGRPFAVVTPLALKNRRDSTDLTVDMLERKYKRLSVYSEGITETLLTRLLAARSKKYQPVLTESWLQGKAELYLITDLIVSAVLVPPSPPGGGKPPFGFSDDAFRGKLVYVDPRRISLVHDGKAVVFPVVFNPDVPGQSVEIWVGARQGEGEAVDQSSVEALLLRVLTEVESGPRLNTRVEDALGRAQVAFRTQAFFARTKEAAIGGI